MVSPKTCWVIILFLLSKPLFKLVDSQIVTDTGSTAEGNNRLLELLADGIIEKYFFQHKCLVVLSEKGLLKNLKINSTVTFFETESEDEYCPERLKQFFKKTFEYNCDGYIVQFRNPKCAFDGWFETNRQKFVPRHNPKYLFLPVYPDVLEYGDELLSMRISDISANILVAEATHNESEWQITLSTNNFYKHPIEPNRVPKIYLDEWHYIKGFKYNSNLYPDKVADLKGKKFRIATDNYPPFVTSTPDGFENQISLQFCILRNCTPLSVQDESRWGSIDEENLTGTGVYGNVYADNADVGTMAVYLWLHMFQYMDYSASYHSADVTVMTPKPQRVGGWIVPFMPFKVNMWIAFGISLLLSTLSLFLITKASIKYTRFTDGLEKKHQFTTIVDSSMRAVGLAVLQMPSSRLIGDSPNRYLFTSFEFLYLVLSAMYSAELASFLTVARYYPPIDKFHDFAKSGIHWFAEHEVWTYALRESSDPDPQTIVSHFHVVSFPELKRLVKEGKYGFTAERLLAGAITEQEHVTEDVIPMYHIMKDPFFGSPIVALLKKGGPYNEHFNRIVNKVVEHGLTIYWESYTVRTYMNYRIQQEYQKAKSIQVDSEPTVIELSHILGIIYLYTIGISLAFIVFIYEITFGPKARDQDNFSQIKEE